MPKPIKPGTDNQKPGTYKEVGPRGGEVPKPRVVKIDRVTACHDAALESSIRPWRSPHWAT